MGIRKSIFLDDEIYEIVEMYRRERAIRGELLNFSQAISKLIRKGWDATRSEVKP